MSRENCNHVTAVIAEARAGRELLVDQVFAVVVPAVPLAVAANSINQSPIWCVSIRKCWRKC